jgi:hypothetical protein
MRPLIHSARRSPMATLPGRHRHPDGDAEQSGASRDQPAPAAAFGAGLSAGFAAAALWAPQVAVPVPVPPELSVEVSFAGALSLASAGISPPSCGFFFPSCLKSVSCQPAPFSRNPAAVICLFSAAAPHAGQSVRGHR